ncbi:uncharacterized protein LOC128265383 [Drosophila gunungcola]|uniref:Uncharacterized protein n=1 Tax=Drosophila gunungcola TaxID=103775 RepID=A0A9P9YB04_9MUSC|nr:uncharacterized protein LOC128265383 [Drosophila gunungcola]KAI8033598.1 hypothetical protein M5D96_013648 [Drosophila gunungcola]
MHYIFMMSLFGLLILSLFGLTDSYGHQPVLRNIIKVRASGFMPFESDLLLPLNILRQLQDRSSRFIGQRPKPVARPKVKQQVRLERAHPLRGAKGVQLYNLIDDDGELLLNLKVHQDPKGMAPPGIYQGIAPEAKYQSKYQDYDTPWIPSKWRPTSEFPLGVTSSSPRPLPLHQYVGQSNRIEQNTGKRRRQDMWPHK